MIVFENIDTGETVGVDRKTGGNFYRAKLSAIMNSSNMHINADRGQDFGWRLIPEQQAVIEMWETDPEMIDRVSTWSKVMVDDLTHTEFLAYLLYQEERGVSPERSQFAERRTSQQDYEARVQALKNGTKADIVMPVFSPKVARGEETLEDFLSGDLTGDEGGDKVLDETAEIDTKTLDDIKLPEQGDGVLIQSTPKAPKTKK